MIILKLQYSITLIATIASLVQTIAIRFKIEWLLDGRGHTLIYHVGWGLLFLMATWYNHNRIEHKFKNPL
jgi:hypothetical protein